ncbi:hypothetical protein SAMN05216357_11775 [Porphyromonadaceae bacterium KH3CP3RA]|nr:hypothetical protein SAMN05216357_11775 [Porphyromonadaceae bacterium KH3CP3RA]
MDERGVSRRKLDVDLLGTGYPDRTNPILPSPVMKINEKYIEASIGLMGYLAL